MMIRPLALLVLLLLSRVAFGAQPKPARPPLEFSVQIVSQSYCAINEQYAVLELQLKLRFRNVGKQKLILYKGHDLFFQSKILSAPGNASGPYGVWLVNSRYFDEEIEPIDQPSPGRVFLTLSSGKTWVKDMTIGVGVVDASMERGDSSIRAGDQTLQLIVSMWYKSRALAQKLREQWQKIGLLWSDPLSSVPIPFGVQKPRIMAPCKSSN
jgi:hypothetical protein